jgi:uncharacterized membrane protein
VTPDPEPAAAAAPRPAARYAVLLGTLAVAWGSSYLFIKIGVETLPPLSLVLLRVLVGLAILLAVVAVTRTPLPRDARTIAHLAVLGAVNIAIPFWLIGWAEQHISSGLAGLLQSTAPFFTLVIAASFIHDERVTRGRLAGIGLGFVGILLLSVENLADLAARSASAAPRRAGRRGQLARVCHQEHLCPPEPPRRPAARPRDRTGGLGGDPRGPARRARRRRRHAADSAGGRGLGPLAGRGRDRPLTWSSSGS